MMHGPHEPSWIFYRDQIDYIARNNYILQQGIPKMDVAIWQKETIYPKHVLIRRYNPTDLEDAGMLTTHCPATEHQHWLTAYRVHV